MGGFKKMLVVFAVIMLQIAAASVVVLNGQESELASFVSSNILQLNEDLTYNITGVLVPISLVNGCNLAANQTYVSGPNISFVQFTAAVAVGCKSYQDIVLNILPSLSSDGLLIAIEANSQPGYFDNYGDRNSYANLELKIALISKADGVTVAQLMTAAAPAGLLVQMTSDIGPFLRYTSTPPFTAYRVISSIIYYSMFLWCCYQQTLYILLIHEKNKTYHFNLSNNMYIMALLFTLLRAIECSVNPLGLFTTFSDVARYAIWWTAYFLGFSAICGMLAGWAQIVVSSRDMPKWSLTALYVYIGTSLVSFVITAISRVYWISNPQIGTLDSLIYDIFIYIFGATLICLALSFCFFGIWLLTLLQRIAVTLEKKLILRKITGLMIIETLAMMGFLFNDLASSVLYYTPAVSMLVTYLELVFAVSMTVMVLITLHLKPYKAATSAVSHSPISSSSGLSGHDDGHHRDTRQMKITLSEVEVQVEMNEINAITKK